MPNKCLIFAHRGVATDGINNTLDAFNLAIDHGADFIEFDVRKVKDAVVVFHDEKLNGEEISDLSYSQLQERAGYEVPKLKDVLQLAKGRIATNIELKEVGYAREILDMVRLFGEPKKTIISSFEDDVLVDIKKIAPGMPTGLILGRRRPKSAIKTRLSELWPARRIATVRPDFVMVNIILARLGVLDQIKLLGLPAIVWTVDRPRDFKRYSTDPRVAGIITNEPALALKVNA